MDLICGITLGYYDHGAPVAERREFHFKIFLDRVTGTLNILSKKFYLMLTAGNCKLKQALTSLKDFLTLISLHYS